MARPRRTWVWIAGVAIVVIATAMTVPGALRGMTLRAQQESRERVVRDIGAGKLVPAPHGRLPLSKAVASECGCAEAFAQRAPNGFAAVVFVDARFKNANFYGRLYVTAPLDSPLAKGSKLVYGNSIDAGRDQGVYIGDKIDDHWYWAYYDQD